MANYLATAETDIDAAPARVWEMLTDPESLKQLWFGAEVKTDWQQGSAITWSGDWEGKPYEDKGEILEVDPGRLLKLTHWRATVRRPTSSSRRTTTRARTRPSTPRACGRCSSARSRRRPSLKGQ